MTAKITVDVCPNNHRSLGVTWLGGAIRLTARAGDCCRRFREVEEFEIDARNVAEVFADVAADIEEAEEGGDS